MSIVIKVENVSKQYRLGQIGTGSLAHDVNRFWHKVRGKEDPYLKIGDENDRTQKVNSDYVWALRDINFDVPNGEALGIIGRNGAGKSTLLKILSRTTTPTTGSIKIKGRIASLLEVGTGFHPELSGRDNIFLNGSILGMTRHEIKSKFDEIVNFAGVERYIDTPVKRYSSGMYVRLAFAVAAHLEPEILIVDEVLAVGDAEFQKKAIGKMQDISKKEGRTVLFVSHNMATIQNLCNSAILMKNGKVEMIGQAQTVINSYLQSGKVDYGVALTDRKDRMGNGKAIFSSFHVENTSGNLIDSIISGSTVSLVFTVIKTVPEEISIDLGLALSTINEQLVSILYSSYQNHFFKLTDNETTIKLTIPHFPLSHGFYKVVGRILNNGEETDSLQDGIGEIQVIDGDFYNSGNFGSMGVGPLLLNGNWNQMQHYA